MKTVALSTRFTKNISSLIDVVITNKQYNHNSTEVLNLGDSDHFAQILCCMMNRQNDRVGGGNNKKRFVEETLKNLNTYSKRNQRQTFI